MNRPNVQYKFYATLLDSFTYFQNNEYCSFQEFIDKLNRVPFTSPQAEQGTAFNQLVNEIAHDGMEYYADEKGNVFYKGFAFKKRVVDHFVNEFRGSLAEVYTEAVLETRLGNVLLYGYQDEVMRGGVIADIKCTSKYDFPKFLKNWQHIVYPFCNKAKGNDMPFFKYEITDYNHTYKEEYVYNEERDLPKLKAHVCDLITFIETHRHLITDLKLFALDEPAVDKTKDSSTDIDQQFEQYKNNRISELKKDMPYG